MGKPLIIWRNWCYRWIRRPNVSYQSATVVELRLQKMGDFYEKPHFTVENFKFREAVKWGLKIFAPNYQKAHPYAKSGRTNCLAYVAVTLFWHYTVKRKKLCENRHWKLDVVYNTTPLLRRRDKIFRQLALS